MQVIKIKVAQNIFMSNFGFSRFLIFSLITELYELCNLFWIAPRKCKAQTHVPP
jgi:hypothetical protein